MRYLRVITTAVFAVTLTVFLIQGVIIARSADDICPVITGDSDRITVSVHDPVDVWMQGLTASDNKDGDLTDRILVGRQSKFVKKGTSEVVFLVFDESSNVGSFTREVVFEDYRSPEFSLSQPLVYAVGDSVHILDRLTAVDAIQGDISDKIKIVSGNVNRSKPGSYQMGIEVSNQYGDLVSVTLPVTIVESVRYAPELELSSYLVYLKPGDRFDASAYLKQVTLSDDTAGDPVQVQIVSDVNTAEEGSYQVVYSYTDASGRTGYTGLTVIVRA